MNPIHALLASVPLPKMVKIRQHFEAPRVADIPKGVHDAITSAGVLSQIAQNDRVAIAVGSRGIAELPTLVKQVVDELKAVGAHPFIVPAMGSHGGATTAGQVEVLHQLGVTEEGVGAPIHATMEVVEIGRLDNGLPVLTDRFAYEADKIVLIARIKPHTAFRGPYESGLAKMITIGLGKQKGAEAAHSFGFEHMAAHIPLMADIALHKLPIVFGLATIENAYDEPAHLVAVPAERILTDEPDLLLQAKAWMPRILPNEMDVLVIHQIGKDVSGDGMDPNITGRYLTPYATGGPSVKRIAVLSLTEKTHGNANGIGLADCTTKRVFDAIDWPLGYANALTSTVPQAVKVPMFLDTGTLAVQAAIKMSNVRSLDAVRLVAIRDTLHLRDIWISETLLPEAMQYDDITILGEPEPFDWDNDSAWER